MEVLFKKYLENQCSPSEVRELLAHFNSPGNELLLRTLISAALDNEESEIDEGKIHRLTDETFGLIRKKINAEERKPIPLFHRKWVRMMAAAVVLLGIFALYNYLSKPDKPEPEIVQTNIAQPEISPGSNKAILTLADGATITLENVPDGELAQEGGTSVVKLQNSRLEYYPVSKQQTEVAYNSMATPRGGQYQLTLSDGSGVWLNAASSIRFPVAFSGRERRVEITGEVYFEVAKNESMPFIVVVANKSEVQVLGTHFNISSYTDEATINITLLEGSVEVTGLATGESRIISPGEQSKVNANGQVRVDKRADVEQAIAWKNGLFNFSNANLEMILRQLSRWYDVDVSFEGAIPKMQFGGEMQRDLDLSRVLSILKKNNLQFRIEGKKLIVMK